MARPINTFLAPTHDEISARAHRIYESEGRPEGRAQEHWLRAEAQLIAERKAQAEAAGNIPKPEPAASKQPRATRPRVSTRTRSTLPISTRPRLSKTRRNAEAE